MVLGNTTAFVHMDRQNKSSLKEKSDSVILRRYSIWREAGTISHHARKLLTYFHRHTDKEKMNYFCSWNSFSFSFISTCKICHFLYFVARL